MTKREHPYLGKPNEIKITPDNQPHDPPRKIDLDTRIWCAADHRVYGEDLNCDHDYPKHPHDEGGDWIEYKCTKCGCRIEFGAWQ